VVGILSDHPLSDENFYDDDVILHYTDADTNTYYRTMASLPGDYMVLSRCPGHDYVGYPCINKQRGFGWSIQGFLDEASSLPVSLSIDQWQSEPDVRSGEKPSQLKGTLTVSNLTVGNHYVLFRWDGVADAFDKTKSTVVRRFTASKDTEVIEDPRSFQSDGATYYRCQADSEQLVV